MKRSTRDRLRAWLGPSWIRLAQRLLGPLYPARLRYAPRGWDTPVAAGSRQGWNEPQLIAARKRGWARISEICRSSGPLGFSYEDEEGREVHGLDFHNIHLTYGYVLARAACGKATVSVLDWGGGLGHYYLLGRALVPDVPLEYHCAEVPAMAALGAEVNPAVHWYADDTWARRTYDLVMINASLQYVREWRPFLRQVAAVVGGYFFLTRIPVVDRGPGFVAVQREGGVEMLHQQFHAAELVGVVQQAGLTLEREFVVGDRPYIQHAPEPCEMRGWLFRR